MDIAIESVGLDVARHPFGPFGFKGHYFHEKWVATASLTDHLGRQARSIGGFAVLWSDAEVFTRHTEVGGNLLMAATLEHALQQARGSSFQTPPQLLDRLLDPVHDYARTVTGCPSLRRTFTLNSLVALDNAAWVLYAHAHGLSRFEQLLPPDAAAVLRHRHDAVAVAPAITYGMDTGRIAAMARDGVGILKIKIGSPGDVDAMLEADVRRMREIHAAVREIPVDCVPDRRVKYYLDVNGRYPSRAVLAAFLERVKPLGAFEHILLIEEPFAEASTDRVDGLGVHVAADESLHDPRDVAQRAALGYTSIALKPAGKTLSMTLRMAVEAHRHGLHCFVADNGCVPLLVDWNKNVAAMLPPWPTLGINLLESNGPDHYPDWAAMLASHPMPDGTWLRPTNGKFVLDETFHARAGGILLDARQSASNTSQ